MTKDSSSITRALGFSETMWPVVKFSQRDLVLPRPSTGGATSENDTELKIQSTTKVVAGLPDRGEHEEDLGDGSRW